MVNLPGEIHAFENVMEFGVKSVPWSFGRLTGLNPKIDRQGLPVFAAEFAHLPATLPGPAAGIQEKLLLSINQGRG